MDVLEVEAASLAAHRRTQEDIAALDEAMERRRQAATRSDAEFVDADIQLHMAIVAAAHNRLLTRLFEEFVPSLWRGLVGLLELIGVRSADPSHGEEAHSALVSAVQRGDADAARSILRAELQQTLAQLHARPVARDHDAPAGDAGSPS